jgi:hypothetical protein
MLGFALYLFATLDGSPPEAAGKNLNKISD